MICVELVGTCRKNCRFNDFCLPYCFSFWRRRSWRTIENYSRVVDWSGNYSYTLDWSSLSCSFMATSMFLSLLIYSMKIHMLNHLQETLCCNFGSTAFLCWHISYFNVTYWIKLLLSILLSYTSIRGNVNSHINVHINMYAWNMLSDVA